MDSGAAIGSTNSITYTTSTTYNPVSRTVNTTNLPGEGNMPAETLSYGYNQNALPTTLGNNSDTYVYWTDYNHLGQVLDTTMGDPGTEVVQSYTYNPSTNSLLGYTLDAQAASSTGGSLELDNVSYTYDDAGQQTSDTDVQAGTTVTGTDAQCYQYDYLGRLSQAWTDTAGTTTDPMPQAPGDGACTTTAPSTSTLGGTSPYWQSYTYDATGNRKTETDHSPLGAADDNTVTSLYNAVTATNATGGTQTMPHGIASTSSTNGSGAQTFSYDAAGNTTEIQSGSGNKKISSGGTLASGASLTTNTARLTMQTDGDLALYSLKSGQRLWHTNTAGNPGATATMAANGALTVATTTATLWTSGTTSAGASVQLQDDSNLVMYSTTGTEVWSSGTYNAANSARDIKLTYDHNGRLATTTQGTVTSSYTYDASGNLIARTDSSLGLTTLFLGDDQITVTSTGTITGDTRSYTFAGAPTTIRTSTSGSTSTSLQYQANDPQGTATVQISADNKTIVRRMYTPFGTDRTPDGNPTTWAGTKGYIGGTQDNQTGLTNEGAREYDPTLGRFLSRDPILDPTTDPQQWNGYAYSDNDPTNSSDPTGNRLECGQNGNPACPSSCPNGRCAVPPSHSDDSPGYSEGSPNVQCGTACRFLMAPTLGASYSPVACTACLNWQAIFNTAPTIDTDFVGIIPDGSDNNNSYAGLFWKWLSGVIGSRQQHFGGDDNATAILASDFEMTHLEQGIIDLAKTDPNSTLGASGPIDYQDIGPDGNQIAGIVNDVSSTLTGGAISEETDGLVGTKNAADAFLGSYSGSWSVTAMNQKNRMIDVSFHVTNESDWNSAVKIIPRSDDWVVGLVPGILSQAGSTMYENFDWSMQFHY